MKKYLYIIGFIMALSISGLVSGCRAPESNNNFKPIDGPSAPAISDQENRDPRVTIGKVVHISDGDTFVMEMAGGVRATVRIHAIDAPELAQDFGKESREHLRALIANQQVQVRKQKLDQFQRMVGTVFLNGKDTGLQMVSDGYAWHFKQYEKEQPLAERAAYAAAEKTARELQLGLWQDNDSLPPQDYRRTHERRKK